jgi:hypothetical protein
MLYSISNFQALLASKGKIRLELADGAVCRFCLVADIEHCKESNLLPFLPAI